MPHDLAVGVRDHDFADALAADVHDHRVDPLGRDAGHVGVAVDEVALRLARAARVAVLGALGVAEDDGRQLAARRRQRDADSGRFGRRNVLDAEPAVELRVRRLLLENARLAERRQRLAQLARVRDIAVLVADDPVVGALLERRDGLAVRLRHGHALDVAERVVESRDQGRTVARGRRAGALPDHDQHEQRDERR